MRLRKIIATALIGTALVGLHPPSITYGAPQQQAGCIGPNLVANPDFAGGLAQWDFNNFTGGTVPAAFAIAADPDPSRANIGKIDINGQLQPATREWHIRLRTNYEMTLDADSHYRLSFDARADTAGKTLALVLQNGNGTVKHYSRLVNLSSGWITYNDTIYVGGALAGPIASELHFILAHDSGPTSKFVDNIVLCKLASGPPPPTLPPPGYTLKWSDEFDGNALDPSKWQHCNHAIVNAPWCADNPSEPFHLAWHKPSNVTVANSILSITASPEVAVLTNYAGDNKPYTYTYASGYISTRNLYRFKYGYIEGEVNIPAGYALWPGFWLAAYEPNYPFYKWPPEIDILEALGQNPGQSYHTVHFPAPHAAPPYEFNFDEYEERREFTHNTALPGTWVKYGVLWEPNRIVWYVNGKEVFQSARSPNDLMFIILNMHVGIPGEAPPYSQTPPSGTLGFRYVRVYQPDTTPPSPSPSSFENLVNNGDFSPDNGGWQLDAGSATAQLRSISTPLMNVNSPLHARVHITSAGASPQPWTPSMYQSIANGLVSGETYTLSFTAKSSVARPIDVLVQDNGYAGGSWTEYWKWSTSTCGALQLATSARNFVCTFTASVTDPSVNLTFRLGPAAPTPIVNNTSVDIDNVRIIKAGPISNGGFNGSSAPWLLDAGAGGSASFAVTNAALNYNSPSGGRTTITSFSSAPQSWIPTMRQVISGGLIAGKTYTISFSAKGQTARNIDVLVQHNGYNSPGWTEHWKWSTSSCGVVALQTSMRNYVCSFTATVTDPDVFLGFRLGPLTGGAPATPNTVDIDDVVVLRN